MRLIDVYSWPEAPAILYLLLAERAANADPYASISHHEMPSHEEHMRFYLSRPYRYWYLIWDDEHDIVGDISATRRNEIGIHLFREFQGKHYGPEAIKLLVQSHEPLPAIPTERVCAWLANINPANERSREMFKALGFGLVQVTYQLDRHG